MTEGTVTLTVDAPVDVVEYIAETTLGWLPDITEGHYTYINLTADEARRVADLLAIHGYDCIGP